MEAHSIQCKIFADDVKIYSTVLNVNCTSKLQAALNLISAWAGDRQLPISIISKCSILNIGSKAVSVSYHIRGNILPHVKSCRDLGVMLTSELSPSVHISEITVKGHQRANAILRCFETRDRDLSVRAFVTYVRTSMEYNSVVWSPDLKRDIDAIEKFQRRFTKRLAGLKKLSYGQRLKLVNLPSFELTRLHTDLLWCYKIVFGVVDLMCDDFFKLCPCTVTRGHVYKLYKPSSTSSASNTWPRVQAVQTQ